MASKPVVVFSKSYCPYCKKAKTALNAVSAKFEVRHVPVVLQIYLGKGLKQYGVICFLSGRHIFECHR